MLESYGQIMDGNLQVPGYVRSTLLARYSSLVGPEHGGGLEGVFCSESKMKCAAVLCSVFLEEIRFMVAPGSWFHRKPLKLADTCIFKNVCSTIHRVTVLCTCG